MKSPFKFLDAYDRRDQEIFFGRQQDVERLYELIHQSNLLLVYGQSGTGKTSLIQCGLANRFLSTEWFDLFIRRQSDINDALRREISKAARTPIKAGVPLPKAIHSLYLDVLKPIYLIFDQFEELFILGSAQEQKIFIQSIAELLDTGSECKIIIIMREEYIASLYGFEKEVPSLFKKRFRVEPMSHQNMLEVITGTTKAFEIGLEKDVATAQQILDNLSDNRAGVQLSYLQVYLDKLFHTAAKDLTGKSGSDKRIVFTEQLVEQTGKLDDVMRDFLEEQTENIQKKVTEEIPETPAETVRRVLEEFATLEGTKQPMTRSELSGKLLTLDNNSKKDPIIDTILSSLESGRLLRRVESVYELAHDTLASSIADKRSVEEKNRLKAQNLIKDRQKSFEQTHTYLSRGELAFIDPYVDQLHVSGKELQLVKDSKRRAQRAQRLVFAGIIFLMALFAIFAWREYRQNELIGKLLKLVVRGRDSSFVGYSVEQIINSLNNELDSKVPLESLIIPKAKRTKIPGAIDKKNGQIYDYHLWIDLPKTFQRDSIKNVQYSFHHSAALDIEVDQEKLGEVPEEGFFTSYRSWLCIPRIRITINLKNRDPIIKEFNMYEYLSKTDGVTKDDTVMMTQGDKHRGTIFGSVVDRANEKVIIKANVVLEGLERHFSTTSNTKGVFTIGEIPLGKYSLTISKSGYDSQKLTAIEVGETTNVEVVRLRPKPEEPVKLLDNNSVESTFPDQLKDQKFKDTVVVEAVIKNGKVDSVKFVRRSKHPNLDGSQRALLDSAAEKAIRNGKFKGTGTWRREYRFKFPK